MKQNKLYSWLTSLLVMVMLALVGQTALAQDVTFTFTGSNNTLSSNEVDGVRFTYYMYNGQANLYANSWDMTISSEREITKIEFTSGDMSGTTCDVGTMTSSNIWEGSANSVTFNNGGDKLISQAKVWLKSGPVEVPTYNFLGSNIPYITGGASSTLESGENLQVGDVFTGIDGSTLTFTAVVNAWSNSAQRLRLGNGTAFSIAAPEGYNISDIVLKVDANTLTGLSATGLSFEGTTKAVWSGEAASVDFSVTADSWVQKIYVTLVSATTEPTLYTVVVNDAPVGAAVTLDGQDMAAGGQITVEKNLSLSNLSVTEPTGYYAEKEYDATTHTFTVTFKEYLQYPVVVTGTTDANAGVVYDGVTYHAGESVLTKTALTAADVTAAEVSDLEGTVTLDAGTFTVTYKAPEYIEFITTGLSGYGYGSYNETKSGVNIYAAVFSGYLNIWNSSWTATISSSTFKIAKVEFECIQNLNISSNVGSMDNSASYKKVWTGSAQSVIFSTVGDLQIAKVRVYLDNPTPETYTVSISGNPSEAKLIYDGNEYANGSSFTAALTKDDLSATTIEGYSYSITIEGTTIKVVYAEKFPKEGVAYKLLESGGLYLNVFKNTNNRAKDVVLLSTPQALYFTETTGGFHIQDANGYYVGGYSANTWNMNCETPEVWTVEPVTGGYALKCVSTGGYLGFNDNTTGGDEYSAGYRDKEKGSSACGIFSILTFEKGTFGLAASQKTDITGEEISRYPNINLAEDYTMALGLTDQQVYIQDAMKFYKVVEGVDVEISSPIGEICVYPSSSGQSTAWLIGSQNCETPGVYKFVFPKGLFENAANENEEFTITYTVEKQLHYSYSNAVQENDFVLNGFDVKFNHEVTSVDVTDAVLYCGTDEVSTTIGYSIAGTTVHFTFTPAIEKAGSYKLSLPAGAVVSDGVATTEVVETYPATVKNRLVVTSAGWTTFCPSENVKLPAGYTPYILTKAEDGQATIQEILGSYPTANEYFWIYSNGEVVEQEGVLISKAYGSSEAVGIKLDANATFTDGDCLKLLANGQVTVSSDYTIKSIYISGDGNCIINGELYTPNTNVGLNTKSFTITTDGGETMTIDYLYVSYEDQTQGRNDVVIPAGEGILVQGAENAAVAYETTWETPSDVTGNLLYGCTADVEYTDYADCYFYKFSLNKNNEAGSEGFYWGSADGHSISMHAGKAYLILDADDAAGIRGFRLFGEETEGISMKTTDNGQQPVYNLQGQRMGGKLSTGIYVKNGKKVLVK